MLSAFKLVLGLLLFIMSMGRAHSTELEYLEIEGIDKGCFVASESTADGSIFYFGNDPCSLADGPSYNSTIIAKVSPAGILDASFGKSGIAKVDVSYGDMVGNKALPNGEVLLLLADWRDGLHHGHLVKLLKNGDLDSSFGSGGFFDVHLESSYLTLDFITAIQARSESELMIVSTVATSEETSEYCFQSLDIGTNPPLIQSQVCYPGYEMPDFRVAFDSNGTIVVAGENLTAESGHPTIRRFLPDGKPDLQFGNNGVAVFEGIDNTFITGLYVRPDRKILVSAGAYGQKLRVFILFNSDGSIDSEFGGDAGSFLLTDQQLGPSMVLADNSFVTCGYVGGHARGLYRYSANGKKDMEFGENGFFPLSIKQDFRNLGEGPGDSISMMGSGSNHSHPTISWFSLR